jgi:medium-chain acyl-[acyl-carrier-protein] hydrolase
VVEGRTSFFITIWVASGSGEMEVNMNRIKLFCIPYAGGSVEIYRKWNKYLDMNIDLKLIELSGRGKRATEPLYDNLERAVDDVYRNISTELDGGVYAIFGHSMGNLIAYEVCHKIIERGQQAPVHIFFSGRGSPNGQKEKRNVHLLPDEEFKKKLKELGGTPEDVLNNEDLLNYFLPIIRADFKIVEQYQYLPKLQKLQSNITVFNGTQDDIRFEDLIEWRNHTDKDCKFYNFIGGHFFINYYAEEIVKFINLTLEPKKTPIKSCL